MSLLENPNVKRVLMIVVALAVVAAVVYVIYHFTAGPGAPHHGGSADMDATTTSQMDMTDPTARQMYLNMDAVRQYQEAETHPSMGMEGFDTQSPIEQREGFAGCQAQQREGFAGCQAQQREGFAGCQAQQREGFDNPMPAEGQQDSEPKTVGADNTLGMNQMPSECYPKDVLSSVDLLPSDANSHYAMVNPNGQGALSDQNFLTAGYHIGINTIGQTLRNANRQLRSDPPCPQVPVSPWNNTTIEYDGNRRPLEIGGAP